MISTTMWLLSVSDHCKERKDENLIESVLIESVFNQITQLHKWAISEF